MMPLRLHQIQINIRTLGVCFQQSIDHSKITHSQCATIYWYYHDQHVHHYILYVILRADMFSTGEITFCFLSSLIVLTLFNMTLPLDNNWLFWPTHRPINETSTLLVSWKVGDQSHFKGGLFWPFVCRWNCSFWTHCEQNVISFAF